MKINELGNRWLSAYAACLNHFQVKDAAAIAKYYRPQKIYKYYCFESKYWRKNTFEAQVPFNIPSDFNDPFDSRWFLDYEKILMERSKEIRTDWSKSDFGGDEIFEMLKSLYEEDLLYLRELFCISCFSATPYSNPMWGHYANKHTGFCLEYSVSMFPKEMQIVMPVVYVDSPFDASMIIDMRGIDDKYAPLCPSLFKSSDWSYEKEWRIVIVNDSFHTPYVLSAPGAITGVYLGLKSYGAERNELENWATREGIPVYQVERSYCSFDLQSDNIKDIRSQKHTTGFLI